MPSRMAKNNWCDTVKNGERLVQNSWMRSKTSLTGDPNGPKGLKLMCNCKRRSKIISNGENLAKSGPRWSKTTLKHWLSEKNVIEFNCFNKIFANTREIIEFNMGKKWNSSTAFQIRESALKTIPQAFSRQTLNPIKKNQKSITANIKNYIKTCLFKNFPFISLFFEIIETLETIEFKTPIIEFKCFKGSQLGDLWRHQPDTSHCPTPMIEGPSPTPMALRVWETYVVVGKPKSLYLVGAT